MKRSLIVAGLAVVALAGTLWGLSASNASVKSPAAPPPPTVTVARVTLTPVDIGQGFTGRLSAVDTVEVRPRVSGYIDTVHFREGELVKKGDVLVTIDPRPYRAEVDRLSAELQRVRAEATLADANAHRGEKLVAQRAVSQEEAERLQTASLAARAQIKATRAALETAALNLAFTGVRSPIDGRVSNARITAGNLVSPGDTLTSVVSRDPVYVYFDIDEPAYLRLQRARGEKGRFPDVALGLADETGYPHSGRIDFIDNEVSTAGGTIRLRAVLDNHDGQLTPGLYARLYLRSGVKVPNALIEDAAIGTDLGNKFVYVVAKDNTIDYRKVTTGGLIDGKRVVSSGLAAGDTIVVNGIMRVRPGMTVTPKLRTDDGGMHVASVPTAGGAR